MFSHYTVSALFAYTPLRSAWLRSFWWSCHGKVPFSFYGIFFSSFWHMLLTGGTSEQPSAQRLPGKSYCCPSLCPAPNEFFMVPQLSARLRRVVDHSTVVLAVFLSISLFLRELSHESTRVAPLGQSVACALLMPHFRLRLDGSWPSRY